MKQPDMRNYLNSRLLCFAFILCFILIEIWIFNRHDFPLIREETDGIHYMSRAMHAPFFIHAFHGPVYSWCIRLLTLIGMSPFTAARLVSIFAGAVFLIMSVRLLQLFFSFRRAVFGVGLLAFNPAVLISAGLILSDITAAAFFVSALYLGLRDRDSYLTPIASGALAAMAYLTRPIYGIMFLFPVLRIACRDWTPRKNNRSEGEGCLFLPAYYLGFVLTALPWLIHVGLAKGNPFWNRNVLNILFGMVNGGNDWNMFPVPETPVSLIAVLSSHPAALIMHWFHNILDTLKHLTHSFSVAIPGLPVGIAVWLSDLWHGRQKHTDRWCIVTGLAGAYLTVVALVWIEPRYLLPLLPVCAAFMILAVNRVPNYFKTVRFPLNFRMMIQIICVGCIMITSYSAVENTFSENPLEYKTAADWLRRRLSPDDIVLSGKPHIAFFAGARNMEFRTMGLQRISATDRAEFRRVLRRRELTGVKYMVFDERYSAEAFPEFSILLDPAAQPWKRLLTAVFEVETPEKLVVYAVKSRIPQKLMNTDARGKDRRSL